jgi:hypothetical protein
MTAVGVRMKRIVTRLNDRIRAPLRRPFRSGVVA